MIARPPLSRTAVRAVAVLTLALAAWAGLATPVARQGAPSLTFDVRVVDRDGEAVAGLTADKFVVEVAGRRRKVLDVRLVKSVDPGGAEAPSFVVAVDALTFGRGASSAVTAVVRALVQSLPAGSRVGLATLPQGPALEVSPDRAGVVAALESITGQWQGVQAGKFGLRAADVMEYLAAADRTQIVEGFCAGADEDGCPGLLDQEVTVTINTLETQARASLGAFGALTARLGALAGPKILVWVSGGLPVAERSGGRPDAGNLPDAIAEAAARTGTAVYTLLLDRRLLAADATSARSRNVASPAREAEVLGRWLEQFSLTVGGALFRVPSAETTAPFARVAREAGARYVVSVESTDADRAGTLPRLRVRVDQRGATVRSHQVIAVR